MNVRRWLLAATVMVALLAMHGLTASTAAAAAPCGVTAPHEHAAPTESDGVSAAARAPLGSPGGHEGTLCLAVLIGGLAILLLARRRVARTVARDWSRSLAPTERTPRAPPTPLLPLLCIART